MDCILATHKIQGKHACIVCFKHYDELGVYECEGHKEIKPQKAKAKRMRPKKKPCCSKTKPKNKRGFALPPRQ